MVGIAVAELPGGAAQDGNNGGQTPSGNGL
jgi:hypothetical protein